MHALRYSGLMVLGALALGPVPSSAQNQPARCQDLEGFHRLDFWVGEWTVTSENVPAGTSVIERILDGCAILEHWRGTGGTEGKSLFFYNHVTDVWKQVWVTQNATAAGGLKEKSLLPILADGALRFEGVVALPDGRSFLDRTTLTPLPDDRVRQVIEISPDRGASWQTRFDAIYARRRSPTPGS